MRLWFIVSIVNYISFQNFHLQNLREETAFDKSLIVSPLSVHLALGLLSMGAGGETAKEIWKGLKFQTKNRNNVADVYSKYLISYLHHPFLKIANAIFVQDGFVISDEFKELATSNFGTHVHSLSFAESKMAANTINDWVSLNTHNLINDFITSDALDAQTKMLIVNALHFKANWEIPFDANKNIKAPFYTAEGKSESTVEMMRMQNVLRYTEVPEVDAKVLILYYDDKNTTMVFVLPNEVNGLSSLKTKLISVGPFAFQKMLHHKPLNKRPMVNVQLPKFKVEFEVSLEGTLKKVYLKKKSYVSSYLIISIKKIADGNRLNLFRIG